MNVPKEMRETYEKISKLLIEYSEKYLNKEYEELCLHALEKLCRKRPSPLKSGRSTTWAAGIVYAIGSNNFIFDKNQPIHMTAKDLAAPFEVAASTASSKAAQIKKMLKIDNVINLRKRTIPDSFTPFLGIKLSGIVLESNSDL